MINSLTRKVGLFLMFCFFVPGVGNAYEDSNPDSMSGYNHLVEKIGDYVLRIDIYYSNWYGTRTPALTGADISASADMVTVIRDNVSARTFLGRLSRYIDPCPEGNFTGLNDVRLMIDVVGQGGSLLAKILSDGEAIRIESNELSEDGLLVGCASGVFRFLFGMGDPGYFGYSDMHKKIIEELNHKIDNDE